MINELLLEAVRNKNLESVEYFLEEQGAEIEFKDADEKTGLMIAAEMNSKEIVQFLTAKGADVRAKDKNNKTAYDLATDADVKKILEVAELNRILLDAAQKNKIRTVELLIKKGANVHARDKNGNSAYDLATDAEVKNMLSAAAQGNAVNAVSQVPAAVSHVPSQDLSAPQKNLDALLFKAITGRDISAVESLLKLGVSANAKESEASGWTALLKATMYGQEKIVELLLKNSANIDYQGKYLCSALALASQYGHERVVRILLKHKPNVDLQEESGWTALMHAAHGRRTEIVRMLLDAGADVNLKTLKGKTAYDLAANDDIRSMLSAAARENARSAASQAVQAVEQPRPMPLLVRIPVGAIQRNVRPEFNKDFLDAVEEGEVESVKSCLAKGADVNARAAKQRTALMIASYEDQLGIVRILIDAGADLDAIDSYKKTALMIASSHGYVDIVKALVKGGADVNLKDKFGHTAKDLASNKEIKDILENAHKYKSSSEKNAKLSGSKRAENAFSQADEARAKRSHVARVSGAKRGNDEIAQTSEDQELNKSLLDAVTNNQEKTARHLLSRGADVDFANEEGLTCLMLAIILHDDGKIAQMLIAEGADVNLADHQSKNTALMSAAQNGKAELVKLLLGKNADVTAKNKDEKTALDLASDAEVRQILEKASETQKLDQNDVEVAGFLARLSNSSSPSSQGKG